MRLHYFLLFLVTFSTSAGFFHNHDLLEKSPHFSDELFSYEDFVFSSKQTFPLESDKSIRGFGKRTIFITIDDGPVYSVTNHMLNTLEEYNIPATFFMVGRNVRGDNRSLLERMNREGHGIANHSYEHGFDYPNSSAWTRSLLGTHDRIEPYMRPGQIWMFRAPGGIWNDWRTRISNAHPRLKNYVGPIFWNVGGGGRHNNDADWKCWSKGVTVESCADSYYNQIMNNYRNNRASLALFHDIRMNSAHMLRRLIQRLENNGINWDYRLVEEIPAVKELATGSY